MNAKTRIIAPLFAAALLMGAAAWIASARAGVESYVETEAYEYDYLPWQLVDPTGEYAEHIETF